MCLKKAPHSINLTQSYEYVTSGNTTGNRVSDYNVSYNRGNATDTILFSYTYDGNGNITSVETKGSQLASHTTEYTYDEAGQLVEAYDEAVGRRYIYSYDVYGNLIARETRAVTASGTETVIEQEVMYYSGMLLTGTSSSVDGTTSYTLDAMGNPVSIKKSGQRYALAWNEGRMLTGFMDMNRQYKNYYTYNEEGLRTKKVQTQYGVTTTTEYVWGKNGLAGFVKGDDEVVVLYGSDGLPIGFNLNGRVYTYVKNLQGDVLRILDTLGSTVVEYTYDPWGVPTITGDTDLAAINPCSYRCYDYDEESGYYYLQSRYYDPQVGRFLNADDVAFLGVNGTVLEENLFGYCANNPVNYSDHSGYWAVRAIVAAASGAIFGGIAYAIGNAIGLSGKNLTAFTASFVAIGLVIGLWKGVSVLHTIQKLIKPVIYSFSNPGKVKFGLKLLSIVQFEIHNPHHNKPIHFVVRVFLKTGQKVWEWWWKK